MALETASYIAGLNASNPAVNDPKNQGDDHLRLLKATLLNTFAGFAGMVIVTGAEAQGATANDYTVTVSPAPAAYTTSMLVVFKAAHSNTGGGTLQVNALGTKPLLDANGNALVSGYVPSGTLVCAYFDGTSFYAVNLQQTGVTQAATDSTTRIATTAQVQAALAYVLANSPALAGVPMAPNPAAGSNNQQIATTQFVNSVAFNAVNVSGVNGEKLTADGAALASPGAYRSEYLPAANANNQHILPNAMTLALGQAYSINYGGQWILYNDLTSFGALGAAGYYDLWLVDNTTQKGVWAVIPRLAQAGPATALKAQTASLITAASTSVSVVKLDESRSLLISNANGSAPSARVLTSSAQGAGNATVAAGASVSLSTGLVNHSQGAIHAALVGPNTVAVVCRSYPSTISLSILTISGTTVTAGAPVTLRTTAVDGSGSANVRVCPIGAGALLCAYLDGGVGYIRPVTFSGTTPTLGAEVSVGSTTGTTSVGLAQIPGAAGAVVALFGTTGPVKLTACTVAANVATVGSTVASTNNCANSSGWTYNQCGDVALLSATQGVVSFIGPSSNPYAIAFTLSGTTITLGADTVLTGGTSSSMCITPISATKALVAIGTTTAGNVYLDLITASGTTFTSNSAGGTSGSVAVYLSGEMIGNGICSPSTSIALVHTAAHILAVDCSGATPVLKTTFAKALATSNNFCSLGTVNSGGSLLLADASSVSTQAVQMIGNFAFN